MTLSEPKDRGVSTTTTSFSFDSDSIARIIEASGKAGVKRFRYLGLELDFVDTTYVQAHEPVYVLPETAQAQVSQARGANLQDEVNQREEELSAMLIEDPVRYEELLRLRDIQDERT